jgi:hypothetical protein
MKKTWAKILLVVSGILAGLSALIGIGILFQGAFACVTRFSCLDILVYVVLVVPYFLIHYLYKLEKYGWSILASSLYTLLAIAFLGFAALVRILFYSL